MPEKKQNKTKQTLKKESEDEFVLKNSFIQIHVIGILPKGKKPLQIGSIT